MESLEQLMHAAQAGDQASYRRLLAESARLARGFVSRRLGKRQDVEDVVQEILLAVHKARPTYHGSRPYKPWLFALANYKLSDHLRILYRRTAREVLSDTLPETIADEDVTFPDRIDEQLSEALSGLNARQKEILHKTKIEGQSNREVAKALGMTETAVKVTVHRAMKQLRKKFTEK